MKMRMFNIAALLFALTVNASALAMLVRGSQTLNSLRSTLLTGTRNPLATESLTLSRLGQNPTLLSRAFATQRTNNSEHNYRYQENNQSEDNTNEQGENGYWWQRFRSRFGRSERAPIIGLSFFGWQLLWTNNDICQTEEDFRNPEKLNRTKEYFEAGGQARIFDVFVQKFDTLKHDPVATDRMLEYFAQTFETFQSQPKKMKALQLLVINNYSTVNNNDWGKIIIKEISKKSRSFRLKMHACELILNASTQTAQHFKAFIDHNAKKIQRYFPNREGDAFAFMSIVHTILEVEEQEAAKGNYTLIHAYRWNIHFLQDLDAHLRAAVYGTPVQPLSLRFNRNTYDMSNTFPVEKRKEIMTKGVPRFYHRPEHNNAYQPYVTFLNYALFTNQYGSNTLQYIANNRCEKNPKVLLDMVFANHDLKKYQIKYAKEIEELEKLHNKASKFGAAYMLSFSPKMLKESVYVCAAGGPKRTVTIEGIGETDDVQLIIDTLRTDPGKIDNPDQMEFVFVVTDDCGFNQKNIDSGDLKIIPFNAADSTLYAQYEQKRNALIAKIKRDIMADRAKWSQEKKIEHAEMLRLMNEWATTFNCLNTCGSRVQEAD